MYAIVVRIYITWVHMCIWISTHVWYVYVYVCIYRVCMCFYETSRFPNTFIRPSSFAGFTLWLTANSSLVLTALAPRVTMSRTCLYLAGRLLTDKTAMLTSNLSGVCFLLWKWNIMRFRRNNADSTSGCFLSGWSYQQVYYLLCLIPLPC